MTQWLRLVLRPSSPHSRSLQRLTLLVALCRLFPERSSGALVHAWVKTQRRKRCTIPWALPPETMPMRECSCPGQRSHALEAQGWGEARSNAHLKACPTFLTPPQNRWSTNQIIMKLMLSPMSEYNLGVSFSLVKYLQILIAIIQTTGSLSKSATHTASTDKTFNWGWECSEEECWCYKV